MNSFKVLTILFAFVALSPMANASFNINIKIDHMVGNKTVEVKKTIQADYNKEIIVSPDGLKNKIILNLKKFNNVLVNGSKISPVQVNMKLVNQSLVTVGYPQTVTSFYNHSAQFAIASSGIINDVADINVSLNFDETN